MRAALISLAGQPHDAATRLPLTIGGKTVAGRQLEFAIAAGCTKLILLGDGAARPAIALSHAAERCALPVQTVANVRGLLGSVKSADELLVLAPGLLPDSAAAIEALAGSSAVLVLPASGGTAARFERIDLDRAWAGALVVPGSLVERLAELPADIDPAAALLRIALQAGITERRLPDAQLADGSWAMIAHERIATLERAWLARRLAQVDRALPSERLATAGLSRMHGRLLRMERSGLVLAAASAALLGLAAVLAWSGLGALAFALVAASVPLGAIAGCVASLRASPFAPVDARGRMAAGVLVDCALIACASGIIAGSWPHKLFAPLVLVGTWRSHRAESWPRWALWLTDRGVAALALAAAAAVGSLEPAIMGLALAGIVLNAREPGDWRG